jgi:8-oxo-dGTP pyrophosphatase MutT (NUDIX family)
LGSPDEVVVIVDRDNRVVGSAPRAEMRRRGLTHRATYVFVFDRKGDVLVHLRTTTKDVHPGFFDACAGGVVLAGEDVDESAARELAEELGVTGVPLERLRDFYWDEGRAPVWGTAYRCVFEGPFRFQPEEVVSASFRPVADVLAGRVTPVTPDSLHALRLLTGP